MRGRALAGSGSGFFSRPRQYLPPDCPKDAVCTVASPKKMETALYCLVGCPTASTVLLPFSLTVGTIQIGWS